MTDEEKILCVAQSLGLERPSVFAEQDEDLLYAELNEDVEGYGTKKFCSVTASARVHDEKSIIQFLLLSVRLRAKDRVEAVNAALEKTK